MTSIFRPLVIAAIALFPTVSRADAPGTVPTVSTLERLYVSEPEYPESARRNGEEGTVKIRALIHESGIVKSVKVEKSSGFASLDFAAEEATWLAVYKPYLENGKPVSVYILIPFKFELSKRGGSPPLSANVRPFGAVITATDIRPVGERIKSNIHYEVPSDLKTNPPVEYAITLLPNGTVHDIIMVKSSGLPDFDNAVRQAIEKTQPYPPMPENSENTLPRFVLISRPK